jgi:hypothetical protein
MDNSHVDDSQTTIESLYTLVQRLGQTIDSVQHYNQQRYQNLEAAIQNLAPTTGENSESSDLRTKEPHEPNILARPKGRFPDVTLFTGEDPTLYAQFELKLRTKLRMDAAAYPTEEEQVYYAFGRLEGKAAKRMLPWIETKTTRGDQLFTSEFFSALGRAFKDPDQQAKALSKLNNVRQGLKDLRTFLADFDQTLIEAGGMDWDDTVKIGFLEAALNAQIHQGLIGTENPSSYDSFCQRIRLIDEQQKRLVRVSRGNRTMGRNGRTTPPNDPNAMEWEPTQARIAALQAEISALRTNTPPSKNENPSRTRAKWVTKGELQKRKDSNQCLRCGSTSHFQRQCSYAPARPPTSSTQVAATKTPQLDSDDEEEKEDPSY